MGFLAILKIIGAFLKGLPWQVWAAIAAVALIAVGIHMHGNAVEAAYSAAYAQGSHDTAQSFQRAQAKADALALKQKQDTEARYAALASQKDHEFKIELQDARDAAARYIATHSVRAATRNQGGSSTAATSSNNSYPRVPESVPARTVLVSPEDVQACTAAVSYGISAHNWAQELLKTNTAKNVTRTVP